MLETLDAVEEIEKSKGARAEVMDEIRQMKSFCYGRQQDCESSYKLMSEMLVEDPTNYRLYAQCASEAMYMGNFDAANEDIANAIFYCDDDYDLHKAKALSALIKVGRGETDEAAVLANEFIERGLDEKEAEDIGAGYIILTLASVKAGQIDDAVDLIMDWPELSDNLGDALKMLSIDGKELLRQLVDRIESSSQDYDVELYDAMADLASWENDWETAKKYYLKNEDRHEEELFKICLKTGDVKGAETYAKRITKRQKEHDFIDSYEELAEVALMANNPDKAKELLFKDSGLLNEFADPNLMLGNIYLCEGDYDEALGYYHSANNYLGLLHFDEVLLRRADAFKLNGDKDEALKYYRMAEVCSDNAKCRETRVAALTELGRIDDAKEVLQKILDDNMYRTPAMDRYFMIARLYSRLGDVDNALKYLEMSVDNGLCRPAGRWLGEHLPELAVVRQDPRYTKLASRFTK